MSERKIYIILKKKNEIAIGHAIRNDEPTEDDIKNTFSDHKLEESPEEAKSKSPEDGGKSKEKPLFPQTFSELEQSFSDSVSMYRDSVLNTLRLAPILSHAMVSSNLERFSAERGEKISKLCTEEVDVFSLPQHTVHKINKMNETTNAILKGASHLPKISTIGLVSSYDSFLSDLLRVIFSLREEIILSSEKEIKLSDLVLFDSIEAAKNSVIADEIELVIRKSHHEQFSWMEKKFSIKLREGLDVWPDFVELCERRNLLTHTGGVVSEQYLKNCLRFKIKTDSAAGDMLKVDIDYLKRSIEIITEIGFKLIHTMWRKFSPDERELADSALNNRGMDLISKKQYKIAAKILEFGVSQRKHHSDLVRKMMTVNLANAEKLDGNTSRSKDILRKQDWSATSYFVQICVAAVRDEYDEVCNLLMRGPETTEIDASSFRDWPVFKNCRESSKVAEVFEEVYREKLFRPSNPNSKEDSATVEGELTDENSAGPPEISKAIH